ncbi:PAAR domain-containing protein, partial [Luteibacter sp.]|uniref:PAAR domain-containing protein n=1 Tax=Luteibacter sp. TaxID=1886636 RepID=UPI0039C9512F
MHRRYTCREGDTTTSGGKIRPGGSPRMIVDDKPAAAEGDPVACPACGSVG